MHKLFFQNLLPGTVLFNKYELLECISSSHIGGVYRCRYLTNPDQLVALKVLSTPAAKDEELRGEFEREVRLSFSVSHPNVIRGLDYFSDEDFTAFAMEYVDGGSLADYIERKQKISAPEIISILTQLTKGIVAIHSAGIIHRDLKPENILIDKQGQVKIADFGIAVHEVDFDAASTQHHLTGTVNYLSPEYIRSGECDVRSDIYALGVIAYELMTGTLPYGSDSLIEALTARVCSDPVSPRFLRPDLPRSLSDMALKAMKRDPLRRYQSADEIVAHLDLLSRIEVVSASEPTRLQPPKQQNRFMSWLGKPSVVPT